MIELLKEHLKQPEYLHVLLNPLPVYGLALGIVALLIAFALKNRRAHVVALVLVVISAGAAWPTVEFGEKAFDVMVSKADPVGSRWLDAHAQRACRFEWVFYVAAGVALAALIVPWMWPKTSAPFSIATLIVSLVALGFGVWIAQAGGQTQHKEFRSEIEGYKLPPEPEDGYLKMRDQH
jgi:hypothetical protein